MGKTIVLGLIIFNLFSCNEKANQQLKLAQTPPMGWNSFDSYGVYLHQEAAMANLEAFAKKLKPHGYKYFVIDAGWFGEFRLKEGTLYPLEKHAAKINFNEYGFLQPSNCYFPDGLQPLIDRCHELGLEFGLHLMRGIPREAVRLNLPIKGTKYHASDIADTTSICVWNHQNYGIDMNKPGAQEFYNGLINQMADWGVDFIKYDDIVAYPKEVKAVANAIAQCGRPIVLSLSPGSNVDENVLGFLKEGNMLRVTNDIWDNQDGIDRCFKAFRKWQGKEEPGFWIDMDMIPFGQLLLMSPKPNDSTEKSNDAVRLAGKGWNRWCGLSKDQMYTFITLRALSASPLMMGGDLPSLDSFSLELITNEEIIKCNQNGVMGKLIFEKENIEIWKTPQKESKNMWIGIFNRNKEAFTIDLTSDLLKIEGNPSLVEVWNKSKIQLDNEYTISANGVIFLKIEI